MAAAAGADPVTRTATGRPGGRHGDGDGVLTVRILVRIRGALPVVGKKLPSVRDCVHSGHNHFTKETGVLRTPGCVVKTVFFCVRPGRTL